jgi:hypothetical protein
VFGVLSLPVAVCFDYAQDVDSQVLCLAAKEMGFVLYAVYVLEADSAVFRGLIDGISPRVDGVEIVWKGDCGLVISR